MLPAGSAEGARAAAPPAPLHAPAASGARTPPGGRSSDSASIVQIFTVSVANTWRQPWARAPPRSGSGSGFVLDVPRRLLVTCAHVVSQAEVMRDNRIPHDASEDVVAAAAAAAAAEAAARSSAS
jgi:S1-C subfamily serine protease